jgi:hypothetical protein
MWMRKRTRAGGARSRRKGNSLEREVARLFEQTLGGAWSRVPLSGGWANRAEFQTCGDVITNVNEFPFVIECKAVEGWHLEQLLTSPDKCPIAKWWRQTRREAGEAGKKPLLVFTRNFQPLYCVARSADVNASALINEGRAFLASLDHEQIVLALLDALLSTLGPASNPTTDTLAGTTKAA